MNYWYYQWTEVNMVCIAKELSKHGSGVKNLQATFENTQLSAQCPIVIFDVSMKIVDKADTLRLFWTRPSCWFGRQNNVWGLFATMHNSVQSRAGQRSPNTSIALIRQLQLAAMPLMCYKVSFITLRQKTVKIERIEDATQSCVSAFKKTNKDIRRPTKWGF